MTTLLLACSEPPQQDTDQRSEHSSNGASSSVDGLVHLTPKQVWLAGLQTTPVEEQETPISIGVTGRVVPRAGAEVEVTSPFPGRVTHLRRRLRMGSRVKEGDTLAVVEQLLTAVESVDFQLNRIQVQATIDQAGREVAHRRTAYDRAQRLYRAGAISLKALQQAELDLNLAQSRHQAALSAKAEYDAALAEGRNTPRHTVLRAPISGTIMAADITSGQYIDSTQTLLTIVDLRAVWIEAHVFETDLAAVDQAREAGLTTRAYPGDVFAAKLVAIGDVIDSATGTASVIFAVKNRQRKLKLGMSVQVRIPTERHRHWLIIPASAVLEEGEGHSLVYVQRQPGIFEPRPVALADRQDERVMVTGGLDVGELVVTAGAQQLHNEALRSHIPIEEEGR